MVHDEMINAKDIPLDTVISMIHELKKDDSVDFFGGEPTLYPGLEKAISFSKHCGLEVYVATNGRRFADDEYTRKMASLQIDQIRTSLYGHNSAIHDLLTRSPGSFDETIQGIKNIVNSGLDLLVNIVITELNYEYLPDLVILLANLSVRKIKFSSLIKANKCMFLVPDFNKVRESVTSSIDIANEKGILTEIEKSPYCLVPHHHDKYIVEKHDPNLFIFARRCLEKCIMKNSCIGIPLEQLAKFGDRTVIPFTTKTNNESH